MSLGKLIEAVERGECSDSMFCAEFHRQGLCTECEAAFHGSLDAAKRLHDALLPGWFFALSPNGSVGVWKRHEDIKTFWEYDEKHARAWLLAILRALEQEGRG